MLPHTEIARTARATEILERWFPDLRSGSRQLPGALLGRLQLWSAQQPQHWTPASFTRADSSAVLRITPHRWAEADGIHLLLVLREVSGEPTLPAAWIERLTVREQQIAVKALRGWDNQLIAEELHCTSATVKKHVSNIFDKLGVSSRVQLFALAQRSVE
jgi:DNA-binding CsgD family transcriptional regulator